MITNVNVNELDSPIKPSTCYACGQVLYSYSLLICGECLDSECEEYANLTDQTND